MSIPHDINDRIAKRVLRHRRVIRDMLAFVPTEWVADVNAEAEALRELPNEYIGPRGDKRVGDILWLADRKAARQLLLMVEHQSDPDAVMAARIAGQGGLLYSSFDAHAKDADGLFPTLLPVVVYTGAKPWNAAVDLTETMAASAISIGIRGPVYLPLDLQRIASEHPSSTNRFAAWANVACAQSSADVLAVLEDAHATLDMSDEDERRLFQDLIDWHHVQLPRRRRQKDWDPDKTRALEDLMREMSIYEINERRRTARIDKEARQEGMRKGRQEGIEQGARTTLVRLAKRRFGADTSRRLDNRLESVSDPVFLEKVGDLILDCDDGEQLLNGLNGTPRA